MPAGDVTWYPRAVAGMEWREYGGGFTLTVPDDPRIHVLNNVGILLLELANGRHSLDEMATIVQKAFQLDQAPHGEVSAFLLAAEKTGLILPRPSRTA